MITWKEWKTRVESLGVKDEDSVRSAELYLSLDRTDFTCLRLMPAPERPKSINQAVSGE